ncbi:IS4 family transposase, partial [Massilia genomosp. 1]|uniref:IS4 family transposase n=1 Tax=Massilia genomosp. 1 TaxID=2609280 RepID=UPI0022771BF7
MARHVSEQAFSKARSKLSATAIPSLNDWLIARADADGYVPRWHQLRLVAADASTLRFGWRDSHVPRAASADQIAFGHYLPGAEMMLAASLHSVHENERQMLFQHLDSLNSDDLLLMDRGYPCRWLVAALNARNIKFCMRVEKSGNAGFACVRDFLLSGQHDQIVTLAAPDRRDAADFECPAEPQRVRLVRHVASTGKMRVLMTNLFDSDAFPADVFGDLYHQRWRIEEAFKRLKHRLNLEHVSGLSQLAAMQDFAAKILCDNLQALLTQAASKKSPPSPTRKINRAAVHSILKPLLPSLLLCEVVAMLLHDALDLIARRTYSHQPGVMKTKQRKNGPKPHKSILNPCSEIDRHIPIRKATIFCGFSAVLGPLSSAVALQAALIRH